jgi:microcin C transport system permease protein
MTNYLLRRLFLMIPTLFGITVVTFFLINLVPGGVLDRKMAAPNRAQVGLSQDVVEAMKRQYGLDKPIVERYFIWTKRVVQFDFGKSFDYNRPVLEIIQSRLPVSLQFGVFSFILTYVISISVGLIMARRADQKIDHALGFGLLINSALPPFTVAILLLVFFAGGHFLDWFPSGFFQSENYAELSVFPKILDRAHHFVLPLTAYMMGSFTALAFLTRNSVLGEMRKDYVRTAKGFGASDSSLFYKHALRNALIPIATGIGGFVGIFLSGSLLIENIFQLNGIGRLGYQSLLTRDYNMIMALTFLQSLAVLVGNLIGDLIYICIDPRIAYE